MKNWLIVVALAVGGTALASRDPLEQASVNQAMAQAPGASLIGPFFHGASEKTDWNIVLESGKCYWFSGVSAGQIEKLALYLWAPNAGMFTPRLTSERSESGAATMAWCTKVSGMYKVQAKIEGQGSYVVGVFAKDGPRQADPPPEAALDLRPICDRTAASSAPGARRVGDFFEGQAKSMTTHDDRFDFPVQLDAGKCYWLVACGEPDAVKTISLYLWDQRDKRVTESKSDGPNPLIGHCAQATGMYRFQVKVTHGRGLFKAAVYSK